MSEPKTVLVADDDPELLRVLKLRLRRLGLETSTVSNGVSAMVKLVKVPPDLFIVDLNMPGADGLSVCEHVDLKNARKIPTILLTGSSDEATLLRCKKLGAHYVCKGPSMWDQLHPLVAELLSVDMNGKQPVTSAESEVTPHASTSEAPRILLIDDHPQVTQALALRLQGYGAETFEATSGMQGFKMALSHQPDLIITDYHMPEGGADYLIMRLQQGSTTRKIPIILITGHTLDGHQDHALKRELLSRGGVVGFHAKPVEFDLLLEEVARQVQLPRARPQLRAAE